jgi:hypothetical protein
MISIAPDRIDEFYIASGGCAKPLMEDLVTPPSGSQTKEAAIGGESRQAKPATKQIAALS